MKCYAMEVIILINTIFVPKSYLKYVFVYGPDRKQKGTLLICKSKGSASQPGKAYYLHFTYTYINGPNFNCYMYAIPIESFQTRCLKN
jgi:hypothetical protein